jgi:hypothetical protein
MPTGHADEYARCRSVEAVHCSQRSHRRVWRGRNQLLPFRQWLPRTAKAVRGRPANAVRDRAPALFQARPRGVSHSIVGALIMAICQWDSKSTVWATGVSSLLWWKVLEERKEFSMPTTINTPTPRCVLCCPRWAVLVRRYSCLSVSSTLLDLRFSVTRKSSSRYALQEDLALVVRHCWR